MSVFDGEQTTATTGSQPTTDDNQDFLKAVTEAKGEQWSDPQVLAKGYVSAQEYIKQLEQQTQELKEDLGKQDYTKELLEQLRNTGTPSAQAQPPQQQQSTAGEENTTPVFSEDELKSLVATTLSELSVEEKRKQNVAAVDSKLTELYGDKAGSMVEAKAKELGMSLDKLQDIASESPVAFMQLVGAEQTESKPDFTQSTVNTNADSFNTPQKRNFAYYQKLRKEDSKRYYSNAVQQQMLQDRLQLGDAFY